jgi:hypothetical protein
LSKNSSGQEIVAFDSTAYSMLRQLREKCSVTTKEMSKWTALQDQLLNKIAHVVSVMNAAGTARRIVQQISETQKESSESEPATEAISMLSPEDKKDISKGLSLIRKQLLLRRSLCWKRVASSRLESLNFSPLREDFALLIDLYDANIATTASSWDSQDTSSNAIQEGKAGSMPASPSKLALTGVGPELVSQAREMQEQAKQCIQDLNAVFRNIETLRTRQADTEGNAAGEVVAKNSSAGGMCSIAEAGELQAIEDVLIEPFDNKSICNTRVAYNSTSKTNSGGGNAQASLVGIDSQNCWSFPVATTADGAPCEGLVLALPSSGVVGALQLQGGTVWTQSRASPAEQNQQQQQLQLQAPSIADPILTGSSSDHSHGNNDLAGVVLPCGLSLATVEPNYELTGIALGDVMQWTALIKSNLPEKFLKRPPVRFLFDLFKFIGTSNPGFLDSSMEAAEWATVGADKTGKLTFMDNVSRCFCCFCCFLDRGTLV